jgi:hypothetical protein
MTDGSHRGLTIMWRGRTSVHPVTLWNWAPRSDRCSTVLAMDNMSSSDVWAGMAELALPWPALP